MSSGGIGYTNKGKFLQVIQNLDFKNYDDLKRQQNQLIDLIQKAPSYNDPNYNMIYTNEIKSKFDDLKIKVRNAAIDNGVQIQ